MTAKNLIQKCKRFLFLALSLCVIASGAFAKNGENPSSGAFRIVFDGFWLGCVRGDVWSFPEAVEDSRADWKEIEIPMKTVNAEALPLDNPTYEAVVKAFLAENGVTAETVRLTQLFRVDLENDGKEEILIYAQNILDPARHANLWNPDVSMGEFSKILPPRAEEGDYSVLLMIKDTETGDNPVALAQDRAEADSWVVNRLRNKLTPLIRFTIEKEENEIEWITPEVEKIFQFEDLNGDGVLEIITGYAWNGGYGYTVFEVAQDGEANAVLGNGGGI